MRARHPLERRTAILLISLTYKHRAPSFWSQHLLFRRPMSMCIRHGGPSSTRVLVHTLIRGPAQALSSSIWIPVSGQHYSSRGSKTSTYHVWGASCMLPYQPLKISNLYHYPYPLFHCHLTPLHARIPHAEKASPLSGVPLKPIALSPQNCLTHMAEICRKQGECHQYWATYLCSLKTLM